MINFKFLTTRSFSSLSVSIYGPLTWLLFCVTPFIGYYYTFDRNQFKNSILFAWCVYNIIQTHLSNHLKWTLRWKRASEREKKREIQAQTSMFCFLIWIKCIFNLHFYTIKLIHTILNVCYEIPMNEEKNTLWLQPSRLIFWRIFVAN